MKKRPKIKRKNIITGFTRRNRLANAVDEDLRGVPLFIDEFRMAKPEVQEAMNLISEANTKRIAEAHVEAMWGKPMMKVKVYVEKGGYVQILRAGTDESALHHTAICIGEIQLYHPATDPMKEKPEGLVCPNCNRPIRYVRGAIVAHTKTYQYNAESNTIEIPLRTRPSSWECNNCDFNLTQFLFLNKVKEI